MMFGGKDTGVEEDEADDQPEHPLGLANLQTSWVCLILKIRIQNQVQMRNLLQANINNLYMFFFNKTDNHYH